MDNSTTNGNGNIYYRCRKEAAMFNERLNSREGASELLGLHHSTLANYELGLTKFVPPESVVMMADLYKAPELKNHYCVNECPIGRNKPISANVLSLERATIKMIKAFCQDAAASAKAKLVDIAADGVITEDDLPTLQEVVDYLHGMAREISELKLACQKAITVNKRKEGEA